MVPHKYYVRVVRVVATAAAPDYSHPLLYHNPNISLISSSFWRRFMYISLVRSYYSFFLSPSRSLSIKRMNIYFFILTPFPLSVCDFSASLSFFFFTTIRFQFDDKMRSSATWMCCGDKLKWSFCCFTSININRAEIDREPCTVCRRYVRPVTQTVDGVLFTMSRRWSGRKEKQITCLTS